MMALMRTAGENGLGLAINMNEVALGTRNRGEEVFGVNTYCL